MATRDVAGSAQSDDGRSAADWSGTRVDAHSKNDRDAHPFFASELSMKSPPTPSARLTAADFPPQIWPLFDAYVHGSIDRRTFLDGAAKFAVGSITAVGLLEAL